MESIILLITQEQKEKLQKLCKDSEIPIENYELMAQILLNEKIDSE